MQIGLTEGIAGKALTDQGSGDVNGDAEIFAGLISNGMHQLDPARRPTGPASGKAAAENPKTDAATPSDKEPAGVDPALIQSSQLAAIFSGATLSADLADPTQPGAGVSDLLLQVSGDDATGTSQALISQLTSITGSVVSGVTPAGGASVATGQAGLAVPGLVEAVAGEGELTPLRVSANAKSDGMSVAAGKASGHSLFTEPGAPQTPQLNIGETVKASLPAQMDAKLSALLQNAGLVTDPAVSSEAGVDLIGEDAASQTDLDPALQLKSELKTGDVAHTQATRTLSGSHMAAVVSRVSEQFLERFNGKTSTFEIRLDPPELGKVDVRVEVGKDGKIMAVIAARDPAVADALMRGAKTLENALTQAGLTLSEGGVRVEIDQKNGSGFSGFSGDEVADSGSGPDDLESPSLAEAGDDTSVIPVIESWSRGRLDVTA